MRWLIGMMVLVLVGCDAVSPDRAALLATSNAPVERPRCDACHAYAPETGAHRFHLTNPAGAVLGCKSCHSASIAVTGPVFDSAFTDSAALNSYNTNGWPWKEFSREGKIFDSLSSEWKDSVPAKARPPQSGQEFPEWIVRGSDREDIPGHANGKVDVVIDPKHHERGGVAQWHAQTMTCSSVKCHDDPAKAYLWKEPVK